MKITAAGGGNDEQHPGAGVLGLNLQLREEDARLERLVILAQAHRLHLKVTDAVDVHVLQGNLVALRPVGELQ